MNGGSTSNRTPPHRQLPRMILLIHESTLNAQLLNNSALSEPRSMFYVFVKEFEDIVLPLRNPKIEKIVSVVRCLTKGWIDFQSVRFVQTAKFVGQLLTGRYAVIVCCLNQHNRSRCLSHRSSKSLAQFERAFP